MARAHAYIKTNQFQLAKRDANRAIDIYRASDEEGAALFSGVAWRLSTWATTGTPKTLSHRRKLGEESGLKQWLVLFNEKIAKFGDVHQVPPPVRAPVPDTAVTVAEVATANSPAVTVAEAAPIRQEEVRSTGSDKSTSDAGDIAQTQPEQPNLMPVPKIKHDWYQTETQVVVEVRIKNMKSEDVTVDIHDTSLSVTAKLPIGRGSSVQLQGADPDLDSETGTDT